MKEKQSNQASTIDKPNKNDRAQNKAERQARIAERRPLLKELEQIERNMAQWQADKKVCDEQLNDTALYTGADKSALQALLKTQAVLTQQLETAEERWLVLHEMLEAIPAID